MRDFKIGDKIVLLEDRKLENNWRISPQALGTISDIVTPLSSDHRQLKRYTIEFSFSGLIKVIKVYGRSFKRYKKE